MEETLAVRGNAECWPWYRLAAECGTVAANLGFPS